MQKLPYQSVIPKGALHHLYFYESVYLSVHTHLCIQNLVPIFVQNGWLVTSN